MNTPIDEIYASFFDLVDDNKLHNLSDDFKRVALKGFLKKSLDLYCRSFGFKSNEIVSEPLLDIDDIEIGLNEYFPYEIDVTKQQLIAQGMLLAYLSPKVIRERLLREAIGSRDYNESSHGNQLAQLIKIYDLTKENLEDYIVNHSFDFFTGFN